MERWCFGSSRRRRLALRSRIKAGLPWKFTLSISALIILTSVTLGWFFGRYGLALIKGGLMDRGRSLARNLAYNSEYGVLIANADLLKQLVALLRLDREQDRVDLRADQAHAVLGQDAALVQSQGEVQRRARPHREVHRRWDGPDGERGAGVVAQDANRTSMLATRNTELATLKTASSIVESPSLRRTNGSRSRPCATRARAATARTSRRGSSACSSPA